ncbi:unnamed protein product, partial [Strongylus vulgaris]
MAVPNASEAIPVINDLVQHKRLDLVVYTQDWHPGNHISFINHAQDPDRKIKNHPGEVKNTTGAELDKRLKLPKGYHIVRKGYETYVDSYSAFGDNNGRRLKDLEDLLHNEGIEVVLGAGLAYDICVRHTLEDASLLRFFSGIVTDA